MDTIVTKIASIPPQHRNARLCAACGGRARGGNRIEIRDRNTGTITKVLHKERCK